jgi:hypothetical protein
MTKHTADFTTWFDHVHVLVRVATDKGFYDEDEVLADYEAGENSQDVAERISKRYI